MSSSIKVPIIRKRAQIQTNVLQVQTNKFQYRRLSSQQSSTRATTITTSNESSTSSTSSRYATNSLIPPTST
ncbi:unnamed protein product [Rotaria sordida]|uniref:Uncharacterized protein n=2 Tax=Rotaria sordida TaxID=392033 RepID=A0A819F0F5_9BILA|nr:unnamed protein product [Rotaria sordida]CAF0832921.1 unnamed protein product [Rotaria sordida]CAF0864019.1 unnamed protein product [Rotaria sordida]CAF3627130.1 unnamed protein product [Rotaria sordida]CAF3731169.1 unnamed protein product [Rotaria sordida]